MGEATSIFSSLLSNPAVGILAVVIFFNGAIYFHELGHFLAARWRGLKVDRFSLFGIGPKIWGWRGKDGVEYCFCWLPIGAYVRLPQMDEMGALEGKAEAAAIENAAGGNTDGAVVPKKLPPLTFTDKVVVAVAGPVCNLILAVVLAVLISITGYPRSGGDDGTRIGYVADTITLDDGQKVPSPAAKAGLKPGDVILAVDGNRVKTFGDITAAIVTGTERTSDKDPQTRFSVEREGTVLDFVLEPLLVADNKRSGEKMRRVGISPAMDLVVEDYLPNSPVEVAGLRKGDRLVTLNGEPVFSQSQLEEKIAVLDGQPVIFGVERDTEILQVTMEPRSLVLSVPYLQLRAPGGASLDLIPNYGGDVSGPFNEPTLPATLRVFPTEQGGGQVRDFRRGDTLKSLGGVPVTTLAVAEKLLAARGLSPVDAVVERDGAEVTVNVSADLEARFIPSVTRVSLGAYFLRPLEIYRPGPLEVLWSHLSLTGLTVKSLFHPGSDVGPQHLTGAVYIAPTIYRLATFDLRLVIWFGILLNLNLAIMNLLPIPVLDGGHISLAIAQKIRGKPLPARLISSIQQGFALLLLGFMGYVMYQDSLRLIGEGEQEADYRHRTMLSVPPAFPEIRGESSSQPVPTSGD